MAANEDEVKLRLTAETVAYKKAWDDVRVQTARDLASIKTTVASNLGQARAAAAQNLAGIKQAAAGNIGQTRVNTAQQLGQIRVHTAQQLAQIRANAAQQLNQIRQNARDTLGQMGSQFESTGRRLSVGLTLPLVALAAAAVRSARNIDTQLNVLRAFTGETEVAEKRFARLIAIANKTPGLTSGLATTLDAQLRPLKVTEQTIDRILPALGRLNAVSPLGDPQKFARNLTQLVTQNFERTDLKELVGQSPVAGQIITELFNVDSPINAAAIRKSAQRMGIRTVDDFFAAFADAASRNPGLANVTESIATRFEKLSDRVALALRPLGLAVIDSLTPIVDAGVPIVEALGRAFAALPAPVRTAVVGVGAFAAVAGPTLFITGTLINTVISLQKAYVALNALALVPTISNLRLLGQVMQGTAGLSAGAAATMAVKVGLLSAAVAAAVAAVTGGAHALAKYTNAGTKAETATAKWSRVLLPILNPLGFLAFKIGEATNGTEDLSTAQARAVPQIKHLTDSIEEESESLRALRLALEEVEIATKSRLAAAQRAYNETRITRAQFDEERIKALREEKDAQLKELDEQIKLKRQEAETPGLGPHGASDEKAKKRLDDLKSLEVKRKQIVSETETEIENIRSEGRQQERTNEERHRDSLLALARESAEREIEILRDAAERDESLRLTNEQRISAIERNITNLETAEIRRRIATVAQGTEERARLEDELALKLSQNRRKEAEARRRELAAERADFESRIRTLLIYRQIQLDVREASEAALITSLRAVGQARLRSAVDTENAIIEVERRGFDRRIKAYEEDLERAKNIFDKQKREEEVAAAKAALAREKTAKITFETNVPFRTSDAEREDIQRLRELNEARKRIQRDALSEALEVGRLDIEAMRRRHASRAEIARAERDADLTEIRLRRERRHDELEDEKEAEIARLRSTDLNARRRAEIRTLDTERNEIGEEEYRRRLQEINDRYDAEAAQKDSKYLERKKELEDLFRDRDLLSEEEYQRRKKEIEDRYKRDTNSDPFKGIKDFWTNFKNAVADAAGSIRQSTASIASTVIESFRAMEDATRQGIVSWLLYGESLGKALKRALAESLAAVAADAAIQALKHGAYAIGSLAFGDARGAVLHAKAATAFGLLALGAGVGARIAANSAGLTRNSSSSAAGNAVGQGSEPNNRQFTYGIGSTPDGGPGGAQGHGLMGNALADVINYMRGAEARDQTRTALVVQSMREVSGALTPFKTASPGDIVERGLNTSEGTQAAGAAVLRNTGSDGGFTDELARNLRVS
jgi:hypothetical protein